MFDITCVHVLGMTHTYYRDVKTIDRRSFSSLPIYSPISNKISSNFFNFPYFQKYSFFFFQFCGWTRLYVQVKFWRVRLNAAGAPACSYVIKINHLLPRHIYVLKMKGYRFGVTRVIVHSYVNVWLAYSQRRMSNFSDDCYNTSRRNRLREQVQCGHSIYRMTFVWRIDY